MKFLFFVILIVSNISFANITQEELAKKTAMSKLEGTYFVKGIEVRDSNLVVNLVRQISQDYLDGIDYLVCEKTDVASIRFELLKTSLISNRPVVINKDYNRTCLEDILLK